MIRTVPFEKSHFEHLELKECYKNENVQPPLGSAFTVLDEDKPIAIVGGHILIPGVMRVWALISDAVKRSPLQFHKEILSFIKFSFSNFNLRRMEFTVRQEYEIGRRWAHSLGFTEEGTMKHYGPDGTDYVLVARVS